MEVETAPVAPPRVQEAAPPQNSADVGPPAREAAAAPIPTHAAVPTTTHPTPPPPPPSQRATPEVVISLLDSDDEYEVAPPVDEDVTIVRFVPEASPAHTTPVNASPPTAPVRGPAYLLGSILTQVCHMDSFQNAPSQRLVVVNENFQGHHLLRIDNGCVAASVCACRSYCWFMLLCSHLRMSVNHYVMSTGATLKWQTPLPLPVARWDTCTAL